MKCPNCRCEVGNQPVCPYCGATVYLRQAQWNQEAYERSVQSQEKRKRSVELKELDRRVRLMETKVNLCLTLQSGTFALAILVLFILALR